MENYRPSIIDFNTINSLSIPENLGAFENLEDVNKFITEKLTALNEKVTASRFMDHHEKHTLREECHKLLELKLPLYSEDLEKANDEFKTAKRVLEEAKELVQATTTELKAIGEEIKEGVRKIELGDKTTWRIAYNGQYHFFTYMNKALKLAKVMDIPEDEKDELFNTTNRNQEFFEDTKANVETVSLVSSKTPTDKQKQKVMLLDKLSNERLIELGLKFEIKDAEILDASKLKTLLFCKSLNSLIKAI